MRSASILSLARPKISTSTKDLDILIRASRENSEAVFAALRSWGAPLEGLTAENFRDEPGSVFQIGTPPFRIDILQRADGISFEEAWQSRLEALVEGEVPAWVKARRHLIKNKLASGRAQDVADVEAMREAENADDSSGRRQKG